MEKGLKVEVAPSATSYTSYNQPIGVDSRYIQPPGPSEKPLAPMIDNDSRVRAWMESAGPDDRSSLQASPSPAPFHTPRLQGDGDVETTADKMQALFTGTTEQAERPRNPPRQRRGSWPQDMSTMINDHIYGAAQEVVDLTGTSLEISQQKEGLLKNLDDAKQKITETTSKLDEKDATINDLTEHFLQVMGYGKSWASSVLSQLFSSMYVGCCFLGYSNV